MKMQIETSNPARFSVRSEEEDGSSSCERRARYALRQQQQQQQHQRQHQHHKSMGSNNLSSSSSSLSRFTVAILTIVLFVIPHAFAQDAPSLPPNFGFLPCSVCGAGEILLDPAATVPVGSVTFVDEELTCLAYEQLAQDAQFSPFECVELRQSAVPDLCNCRIPPTRPPTAPPVETTPAPTDSPVVTTPAPTTRAVVVTPAPTTRRVVVTPAPTTSPPVVRTPAPTTAAIITTVAPTTPVPVVTLAPTNATITTTAPATISPTPAVTEAATTAAPTTPSPTTASPTTISPTLAATVPPTTVAPTTAMPSDAPSAVPTVVVTTPEPPSDAPSDIATTFPVTSAAPTTIAVTTAEATTASPTTVPPTTPVPTTVAATTASPTTTAVPTTASPTLPSGVTASPTTTPPVQLVEVTGLVNNRLFNVVEGMSGSILTSYLETVRSVLEVPLSAGQDPVIQIQVTLESQALLGENASSGSNNNNRKLRQLQQLRPIDTLLNVKGMVNSDSELIPGTSFATKVASTLALEQNVLIQRLRALPGPIDPLYFKDLTSITSTTQDAIPPVPTSAPVNGGDNGDNNDDGDKDDGGLGAGAIAGIVIGGVAFLLVIAAVSVFAGKNKRETDLRQQAAQEQGLASDLAPSGSTNKPPTRIQAKEEGKKNNNNVKKYDEDVKASQTTATAANISGGNASIGDDQSLLENQTLTGGASEYGGDMSYAYSLDPGNVEGGTFVGPAATASNAGGTQSGDEMSSHAMSSLRQNMVSRTVMAPPGKLGIVIDTTLEGPVVHKVNPQSPLEGSLFPGDIIVAIDDVDTRAMSASAITALMVRTANLRRKLTVLSEDITN